MALEDVKKYLQRWGRGADVRELAVSSATVELAAAALGVEAARIAKTISFRAVKDFVAGALPVILVVCAGDARVDNKKFKERFGLKAKMLTPEEALAATGHAVGGVCPFAVNNPEAQIYLDDSLRRFATVFPACGSSNSLIELGCAELFEYSGARAWVNVCKLPGAQEA